MASKHLFVEALGLSSAVRLHNLLARIADYIHDVAMYVMPGFNTST
jgi:hypothetical protein